MRMKRDLLLLHTCARPLLVNSDPLLHSSVQSTVFPEARDLESSSQRHHTWPSSISVMRSIFIIVLLYGICAWTISHACVHAQHCLCSTMGSALLVLHISLRPLHQASSPFSVGGTNAAVPFSLSTCSIGYPASFAAFLSSATNVSLCTTSSRLFSSNQTCLSHTRLLLYPPLRLEHLPPFGEDKSICCDQGYQNAETSRLRTLCLEADFDRIWQVEAVDCVVSYGVCFLK
jgi:hypothetical protein